MEHGTRQRALRDLRASIAAAAPAHLLPSRAGMLQQPSCLSHHTEARARGRL
jgi:hypothetical protein